MNAMAVKRTMEVTEHGRTVQVVLPAARPIPYGLRRELESSIKRFMRGEREHGIGKVNGGKTVIKTLQPYEVCHFGKGVYSPVTTATTYGMLREEHRVKWKKEKMVLQRVEAELDFGVLVFKFVYA